MRLPDLSKLLPAILPLRDYAPKARSFADLLPYAIKLSPQYTLNTDGSITVSYRYRGPDMESSSGVAIKQLADRCNEALRRLDEGWNLQFHADRKLAVGYPVEGAFADATSWIIDEERRSDYERVEAHYVTEYRADFTFLPPPDAVAKGRGFLLEGESQSGYMAAAKEAMKNFEQTLADIEGILGSDLGFERLGYIEVDSENGPVVVDEQLSHFIRCATGNDFDVAALPTDTYVSAAVANVHIRNGFRLRVGDALVSVVSIDEMPATAVDGVLDFLNSMQDEYRASWRFITRDRTKALSDLGKERSRWYGKRRNLVDALNKRESPIVNVDAVNMALDASNAESELRQSHSCFGYYTCSIVLWERINPEEAPETLPSSFLDADMQREEQAWHRLVKRANSLEAQINKRGFVARFERENVLEAFLGTLPAIGYANLRRPMLSSRNFATMLPITATWAGEMVCPCPFYPENSPPLAYVSTPSSTPFALNLHDELQKDVGHTLIAGETGSGKSTLLGLLLAQHRRYPQSRQIVFDVGRSHYALTMGVGGVHYDVGREATSLRFAPFSNIDNPHERLWAEGWVMSLLLKRGVQNPMEKRAKLFQALEYLARAERPWSITKLLSQPGIDQDMREALEYYTVAGTTEGLLDGEEDHIEASDFVCFEMQALMDAPKDLKEPVLSYLIHRVEQMAVGRPTLIVLDEVWRFLDDPQASEAIKNWLKVMRKRNAAVIFATQSLNDLIESPIRDTLIGSCPTKILLANPSANTEFAQKAYRMIGLTPWQIRQISAARLKRDYYVVKTAGRRMVQLGLAEVSLAWIGVSDQASIDRIRQLIDEERAHFETNPNGKEPIPWQARWLGERIKGNLGQAWANHWLKRWYSLGGYATFPPAGRRTPSLVIESGDTSS